MGNAFLKGALAKYLASTLSAKNWCTVYGVNYEMFRSYAVQECVDIKAIEAQRRCEFWSNTIQQCRESGIRASVWCRQNNISYGTYRKWVIQLEGVSYCNKEDKELLWKKMVADCDSSGLSITQWCKQKGVPYARYFYWAKRLDDDYCSRKKHDRRIMWNRRIEDCLSSGLDATEWCRRNGINYHSYCNWIYKIRHDRY